MTLSWARNPSEIESKGAENAAAAAADADHRMQETAQNDEEAVLHPIVNCSDQGSKPNSIQGLGED